MSGHEQPFDQFTLDHVSFHNFSDVGFAPDPIPDAFRINHDAGTIFAMIQTPCLVGTDGALETEALNFLLEERVQFRGPVIGTAPFRVPLGPLIDANENMMLESAHACVSSRLRAEAEKRIVQEGSFSCPVSDIFNGRILNMVFFPNAAIDEVR